MHQIVDDAKLEKAFIVAVRVRDTGHAVSKSKPMTFGAAMRLRRELETDFGLIADDRSILVEGIR